VIANELYAQKHLLAHMSDNFDYEHFGEVYIKEFYQNFRKVKNMSEGRLETAIRLIR
jgi:hypothetical protein